MVPDGLHCSHCENVAGQKRPCYSAPNMKITARLPKPFVAFCLVGVACLGVSPTGRRTTLGFRNSMIATMIEAGDWMAWGTSAEEPLLLEQFREDLLLAKNFNQSSTNIQDWHRTGYLPSDVFHNVREMARIEKRTSVKPKAAPKFCRALKSLSDVDLTLFQLSIEDSGDLLPCKDLLLTRLSTYWTGQKTELTPVAAAPVIPERD